MSLLGESKTRGARKNGIITLPVDATDGRSAAAQMGNTLWQVELFGGLALRRANGASSEVVSHFRTQKTAALIAYLALHPGLHRREQLAERFWPHTDLDAARNNLRVTLSSLRPLFKSNGVVDESVFQITRESLGVGPALSTDLAAFRDQVKAARILATPLERLEGLEAALFQVSGPFLHNFYEDFALESAADFENEFLELISLAISQREERGEILAAMDVARRGVIVVPHRSTTMRELVRLGIKAGKDDAVKREFEVWKKRRDVRKVEVEDMPLNWHEISRPPLSLISGLNIQGVASSGALLKKYSGLAKRPLKSPAETNGTFARSASQFPSPVSPSSKSPTAGTPSIQGRIKLPVALTSFVGRKREMRGLLEAIQNSSNRLITLHGSGGVGKTRLALELANTLKRQIEQTGQNHTPSEAAIFAVAWVPLAHLPSPRLIAGAILDALGMPRGDESLETVLALAQYLANEDDVVQKGQGKAGGRRLLLVLDNYEQLGVAGTPWIHSLLTRCERIVCLMTSRAPLKIRGEHIVELPALEFERRRFTRSATSGVLTAPDATLEATTKEADLPEATRLFIERVRLARPAFQVTNENLVAITQICARLGGFPLAIEVVAARAAFISPSQLLRELESASEESGSSLLDWPNENFDIPSRHKTLRAAIESSASHLPPAAARFWSFASVFRGGFSIEAAAMVCDEPEALAFATTLRDASLLTLEAGLQTTRAVWSEVLREFARETLDPASRKQLEARHAVYFLQFAESLALPVAGLSVRSAIDQIEAERDNLRVAHEYLLQHDTEGALRLGASLWWSWEQTGTVLEGIDALERALISAETLPLSQQVPTKEDEFALWQQQWRLRARVHEGIGKLANAGVQINLAHSHLAAARDIYQSISDERGVASCLYGLGFSALQHGDFDNARVLCETSLSISRARDDANALTDALYNLALVALWSGDFAATRALSSESLELNRAAGNLRGAALSLENLGLAALYEGEIEAAWPFLTQSLALFKKLEEAQSIARGYWALGHVERARGHNDLARDCFVQAAHFSRSTQNLWSLPFLVEAFALLAFDAQQWSRAARLMAGAQRLRVEGDSPRPAPIFGEQFEALVSNCRQQLGETRWQSEEILGRNMGRDELIAFALEHDPTKNVDTMPTF